MRNILFIHLQTKVALAIILFIVGIFLVTVFKSMNDFNKFMDRVNIGESQVYEEIRE